MRKGHPTIPVRFYSRDASPPQYMSLQASGCDVRVATTEVITITSMERVLVPTGLWLDIPLGFEVQVRPRSGKVLEKGLMLANSPGTIDADYRGEIMIICINLSKHPITIHPREKIAQLVFAPVVQAGFDPVETCSKLTGSLRETRGFGSTGF